MMAGSKPHFDKLDMARTFINLKESPMSRQQLAEVIGLGEGTIRTILDILKEKELIESNNQGHVLSEKGWEKREIILKKISMPEKISLNLFPNMESCGIVIKNPGDVKITFEQRDEAIRNGAYSALLFRKKEELELPGSEVDFKKDYRKDYDYLLQAFDMQEKSILIITFAKKYSLSEKSALAVVKKIIDIGL